MKRAELLTPFSQVLRRSAPKGSADILTGRWVAVDANGQVVPRGTTEIMGLYLAIEGNLVHTGDNTQFDGSGNSTKSSELPSVKQSGECALAYGVFRYRVGPEGCVPGSTYTVDGLVTVDAAGRVVPLGGGDKDTAIAKVEAVTTDGNGVTELVLRTLGR